MVYVGVPSNAKEIVIGAIIIQAIMFDVIRVAILLSTQMPGATAAGRRLFATNQ